LNTQGSPADGRALPEFGEPSAAVRAAQERLLQLRRQHGITSHGRSWEGGKGEGEKGSGGDTRYEIRDTKYELRSAQDDELPRPTDQQQSQDTAEQVASQPAPSSLVSRISNLVRVFPDIALAILRRKKAAPGRVWLLLRHADAGGRGRIALDDAARLLTRDDSRLRICGRRQFNNLLAAGDGLFWQRDTDRHGRQWLRLASAARAAAALGVERLTVRPVAVPLASLTGTIGQARAHLYAAFHSGRTRTDLLGHKRARGPIARETLCKLSGASANSQRNYERRAAVAHRSAIALGPRVAAADEHEAAWRRGNALFHLRDTHGKYGRPGATYLAWQLPNEYTGPHATLPRGRMKRLNRALADLFHDGMTGNDERQLGVEAACGGEGEREKGRKGDGEMGSRGAEENRRWGDGERRSRGAEENRRWGDGERRSRGAEENERLVTRHSSLPTRNSSLVTRNSSLPTPQKRFYSTAKAALTARHGRERYWRYREVWLWNDEIRDTKYEIRNGRATDRP